MSDKQFTFFEFHVHDGLQLGPRSLGTGADESTAEATGGSTADAEQVDTGAEQADESGGSVLGPLFGLGLLAAAAYAVKKFLDGSSGGLEALDDIETDAEETAEELQAEAEDSVPIEITTPEEESGSGAALAVAAVVGLLLVLALAAKKLLSGSEEIVVEE